MSTLRTTAMVVALVAVAILALALFGRARDGSDDGPSPTARPAGAATVVAVVDGDTLIADVAGQETFIRLIGIDTPETVHPTDPEECFGAEASAALTEMLPRGTEIRLERDVERRDRFDRLLAYVHRTIDDLFVNEALVATGHADARTFGDNRAYEDRLRQAEDEARAADRGLWGACGGVDQPL